MAAVSNMMNIHIQREEKEVPSLSLAVIKRSTVSAKSDRGGPDASPLAVHSVERLRRAFIAAILAK
jgi:hypothetical protein